MYIKENLSADPHEPLNIASSAESVWAKVKAENGEICIGCMYRRPHSDSTNHRDIISTINKAASHKPQHLIILGDFNYPRIQWNKGIGTVDPPANSSWPEEPFLDCLQEHFLYQSVNEPTRHRPPDTPNLLDLILTSDPHIISSINHTAPLGKSDHSVLTFSLYVGNNPDTERQPKPIYDRGDYTSFKTEIAHTDWDALTQVNIDEAWTIFSSRMQQLSDKYIPKAQSSQRPKTTPWMSMAIR